MCQRYAACYITYKEDDGASSDGSSSMFEVCHMFYNSLERSRQHANEANTFKTKGMFFVAFIYATEIKDE